MSEKNYFSAKIYDLIRRESAGEGMVFSLFLTPEEASEAAFICKKEQVPFFLFGGYPESDRKMLAISSYDESVVKECFPLVLLQLFGDLSLVTHRDVLGALMGTGVRRELIGDILVRDGIVAFFAADHIKDFLIQNVDSVGRQAVKIAEASADFELPKPKFEEFRYTVASLRLDAVVAALCRCSREQANRLIDGKSVSVDHLIVEKKTKEICTGNCVIVRGFGKWIVDQCGDLTKKGRTVLLCRKYN